MFIRSWHWEHFAQQMHLWSFSWSVPRSRGLSRWPFTPLLVGMHMKLYSLLWIVDIKQMNWWSLLWKTLFIYDNVHNHVIMNYFMTPTAGALGEAWPPARRSLGTPLTQVGGGGGESPIFGAVGVAVGVGDSGWRRRSTNSWCCWCWWWCRWSVILRISITTRPALGSMWYWWKWQYKMVSGQLAIDNWGPLVIRGLQALL